MKVIDPPRLQPALELFFMDNDRREYGYRHGESPDVINLSNNTSSLIQQTLIRVFGQQTNKNWTIAKDIVEHHLQILLVATVAAIDIYFILPYQHKLPVMIAVLLQVLIFRFCFVWTCNELEVCIRRLAGLITAVLTDQNVVRVSQICLRRRSPDRQDEPNNEAPH
jgi:hypothetical protein